MLPTRGSGRKKVGRNPRTVEEARALVKRVESLFMPWNVAELMNGFTDDVVVRFGDLPEMRGKAELERFFRARSVRQKGYALRKTFRALMNDTIANYWEGTWEDAASGAAMWGRGVEIWVMRDGKIAVWEASFNVREKDKESTLGITSATSPKGG